MAFKTGRTTPSGYGRSLPRALLLVGSALVLAGVAGGDRLLATTFGRATPGAAALHSLVEMFDLATGKEITNFLLGALIIALAAGLNLWRRQQVFSGSLMYLGLVQFISTTVADLSKPLFGRARPFQAIEDARWDDRWFAGPDFGSFPSGHVAFYVGLCVPIALRHPRIGVPLLAVPALVATQRIVSRDHYMSDVGASILLSLLVALTIERWMLRQGRLKVAPARAEAREGSIAGQGETAP